MIIDEVAEYYSTEEIADVLEKYRIKNETVLVTALKIERWHRLTDSIEKSQRMELLKKIRNRYGFPIWLINEALKYYNNDEDKTVERLIEIYNAIGDHPNVVIKRNIEKFKKEIGK